MNNNNNNNNNKLENKFDWRFPTTDGFDDEGVGDSGVEQFEGDREQSITRECIQNSLDARRDSTLPVKVEFSYNVVPREQIPGIKKLTDCIRMAKEYAFNQEKAEKLYNAAEACLRKDRIPILTISDYNTIGLNGGDKDRNGRWHSLVRSVGSSSKSGNDGGSFGIGKSAPFVASSLRTVFYSTRTVDGAVAFQGKTRISSFEYDGDVKRGTGQYGRINENEKGVASIRSESDIPDLFRRNKVGTDVIIIGYDSDSDWKKRIIKAAMESFCVAIYRKALEIVIRDENDEIIINSATMKDILDMYVDDEEITLLYKVISEPTNDYEEYIDGIGEVELYLRVGEGKRFVQGMRKSLMRVHRFTNFRKVLSDDFIGVVIVLGDKGNIRLGKLEPPAHDKWDIDRGNKEEVGAFEDLRAWIRDKLKSINSDKNFIVEEIPDLGKYLPEDLADDDRDPFASNNGEESDDNSDSETAIETGSSDEKRSLETKGTVRKAATIKRGTPGGKKKKVGKGGRRRNGGGGHGGGGSGGNTQYVDTNDMDVKAREGRHDSDRIYNITIMPKKDENGDIRIVGIGGDSESYPLEIEKAVDIVTGKEYKIEKNIIKNLSLSAGFQTNIRVKLKSQRRYVLGVE